MNIYQTITVTQEGAVDWLTLNRPDQLNAIDNVMIEELSDYFSRLQNDYYRRIVVLRGGGRAFCAGLDLKAYSEEGGDEGDEKVKTQNAEGPGPSLPDLIRMMRSCPQPIISLIHGAACGGGFSLALASDIRIAGHSAKMNVAFIKLGVSGCELSSSYFLPRMVGLSVASELMMTGRFIDAKRALCTGLVSEITDDADMEASARTLVADMLRTSPEGLRKTKETLNLTMKLSELSAIIEIEQQTQLTCINGPNFDEAVRAFIEKREPNFVSS